MGGQMKLHSVFTYEKDMEDCAGNVLRAVFQDEEGDESVTLDAIPTSAAATAWENLEAELRSMIRQRVG